MNLRSKNYFEADFMTEATTTIKRLYDWDSIWQLVHKASSFQSKVQLKMRGKTIDAKDYLMANSLLSKTIFTSALFKGTEVTIVADGPDEAEAVLQLKEMFDSDANQNVEQHVENIRSKRLERLKQYTDDENILANVERVAFEQYELDYLLKVTDEIYLCANRFVIPLRVKNKSYIGIGEAIVTFNSRERVNFDKRKIYFKNVSFENETTQSNTSREVKPVARKDRFALVMEDGAEVRNIDDFKAHFDIGSVVRDFCNGKLLTWLEDRYYDEEAAAIKALSPDDCDFQKKLCEIFGVETPEEIERRIERLNRLKNYTDDKNILANVDKVAFDQEELADLLDEGADEIYLCANRFVIPLRMKNKVYIGVKDAIAILGNNKPDDFAKLGIKFKNVAFDEDSNKIPAQNEVKSPVNTSEITTTIKKIDKEGFDYAAALAAEALIFKSKIQITKNKGTADAKNIRDIMRLNLARRNKITVIAEGSDADEAVNALKELIDSGFQCDLENLKAEIKCFKFQLKNLNVTSAIALVNTAISFKSSVWIKILNSNSGKTFDAKNIFEIREMPPENKAVIVTEGSDAQKALEALKSLINSDFRTTSKRKPNYFEAVTAIQNLSGKTAHITSLFLSKIAPFKSTIKLKVRDEFISIKKN